MPWKLENKYIGENRIKWRYWFECEVNSFKLKLDIQILTLFKILTILQNTPGFPFETL